MTDVKIVYDSQFNANEWFVILGLCVGVIVVFNLPRRFSTKLSIIFSLIGISFGAFSDHFIGTVPVSFYDTSDTSAFDFADILSITMYGPYSYLFFYCYDALKLNVKFIPLYILAWVLLSTSMEWMAVQVGVFHYNHGYWLGISFVIYFVVHAAMVLLYYLMRFAEAAETQRGRD